jgi:hypothetical protein
MSYRQRGRWRYSQSQLRVVRYRRNATIIAKLWHVAHGYQ